MIIFIILTRVFVSVNHMAILANPDLAKFPNMESFCFKKPVNFLNFFINYFI